MLSVTNKECVMIILVGNEKGGVGKSTLAVNIAVSYALKNKDVIIVDTDIQGTAANFIARRNLDKSLVKINCVQKTGDVFETLQDLKNRYDIVIVDAGGHDSAELRSALVAANIILVPMKASQIDLWAADRVNKLISTAINFNRLLKVRAVISMAPTNPKVLECSEALEALAEHENLKISKSIIMERKIYRDSIIEGKGVVEMADIKANDEIETLVNEIENIYINM
jgi:chromosome partitioning protein